MTEPADKQDPGPELEQGAHGVAAEGDRPPVLRIALYVAAFLVALVLILVALNTLFRLQVQEEIYSKQLQPVPQALKTQRAKEIELLSRYEQPDPAQKRYRIPIGRAIEVVAARPGLLLPKEGVVLPPGTELTLASVGYVDPSAPPPAEPVVQPESAPASAPAVAPESMPASAPAVADDQEPMTEEPMTENR